VNAERETFVAAEMKKLGETGENTVDAAMIKPRFGSSILIPTTTQRSCKSYVKQTVHLLGDE